MIGRNVCTANDTGTTVVALARCRAVISERIAAIPVPAAITIQMIALWM